MALELAAAAAGVAGLAGLSIQLMDTALKIQHTYSEAKAAPEVVSSLVFDLQTTSLLLERLRLLHEKSAGADPLLDRFIVACFYRIPRVKKLLDVLEEKFERYSKFRRRLYAVLRESDIESLGEDLRELQRTVRDALALFTLDQHGRQEDALQSLVSGQAEIISFVQSAAVTITTTNRPSQSASSSARARASERRSPQGPTMPPEDEESADEDINRQPTDLHGNSRTSTWEVQQRRRERVRKRPPWFQARIALPTWMCRTVWDIAVHRSSCGWGFNLATWRVVSASAAIFDACEGSDVVAVQKLLDSGEASILDTDEAGWTLLEVAAIWGDGAVLRFLLEQESWPDKTAVVKKAIKSMVNAERYRLSPNTRYLLSHPVFDLDAPGRWICFPESLQLGMRNRQSWLTPEEKLEMSWNLPHEVHQPSSEFLYWVGMSAEDPKLASLRDSQGRNILHYAGRHLSPSIGSYDGIDEGWLAIGRNAIRRGASLAVDDACTLTPLYYLLRHVIFDDVISGAEIMNALRRWLDMMQQGGADLCTYGQYEKTRFDAQEYISATGRREEDLGILKFKIQLEVGPGIEDWSLGVYWAQEHKIYERRAPPGSFHEPSAVPTRIWWSPWHEEDSQDLCEVKARRIPFTVYKCITDLDTDDSPESPFDKLIDQCQDDTGAIMMLGTNRADYDEPPRRRSSSQPPSLRHREADFYRTRRSKNRKWLGTCRFCPVCQRWKSSTYYVSQISNHSRFHNLASNIDKAPSRHIRRCARYWSSPQPPLMLTGKWEGYDFLAQAVNCCLVSRVVSERWTLQGGHTGESGCPEGCGKIKWDKLRIPKGLKPWQYDKLFEE